MLPYVLVLPYMLLLVAPPLPVEEVREAPLEPDDDFPSNMFEMVSHAATPPSRAAADAIAMSRDAMAWCSLG